MIINRPAIDWLTLTTFQFGQSQGISRWVRENCAPDSREVRHGVYDGKQGAGWFWGSGIQNGKQHYKLSLTGDASDRFMFDQLRPSPLDCTRIDGQITREIEYTPKQLFELGSDFVIALHEHEKERGQRARKIHPIIPPDDGEFTIYIGTREGTQRFYRLYVKPADDGLYLRFEVEWKDKRGLAGKIYRAVGNEPESIVKFIAGELRTLPDHELITPFKDMLVGVPGEIMRNGRERADEHKTLRWIKRQVLPAFKKVLGHHDTRFAAMMLLDDLVKFAQKLE